MDVLYYSNNCKHCKKLLAHLAKNGLHDKYNFICIDRRTIDPNTRQISVILDRGVKTQIPPNVTRVPTLLLVNQKYTAVVGEDIYNYVNSKIKADPNNIVAQENGGEPVGFILSPSSGGVNIISETYTMYDAPPEELAAKGNGSTRQMHNYVSAKLETMVGIKTPLEENGKNKLADLPQNNNLPTNATTYNSYSVPGVSYKAGDIVVPELQRPPAHRHAKLGEEITIESLQEKRNMELHHSMPFIAKQLNQIISPEISNLNPPERHSVMQNGGNGMPNYGGGNGMPNYGGGNGMPNYGGGNGMPNYGGGNAMPNYGGGNAMPNYGGGNAMPNYGGGYAMPNYGGGNAMPNYGGGNAMPNYGGGNAMPNYGGGNAINKLTPNDSYNILFSKPTTTHQTNYQSQSSYI